MLRIAVGALPALVLLGAAVVHRDAPRVHPRSLAARVVPPACDVPLSVQPARAARGGPDYFEGTVAAGGSISLRAALSMRGAVPGSVSLATVQAVSTPAGLAYGTTGGSQGPSRWVRLPLHRMRLLPGQQRMLLLQVHVPLSAATGTYITALSLSMPSCATVQRASASIRVRLRLVVAIVLHVRGRNTRAG